MPSVRILTERELRACVHLDLAAVEIVAEAFAALAGGKVVMPPILRLDVPQHNGEVDVKTAYVPGLDGFAMKISPGFFDNPKQGLPSTSGLMVVHSAETGMVKAVLLDNGYLTDIRTAAAGAVAARHLAPEGPVRAGILGAGTQARLQLRALALVRSITEARIWARSPDKAQACAEEMTAGLGLPVLAETSAEAVVRQSEVVVSTTPSREPLIRQEWLHDGLHITAMGSDAEHKNELAPHVLTLADRVVCDVRAQSARLGELHHALASGAVDGRFAVTELGDVVSGAAPGRRERREITVCDLTGTGVQDTAIALHALASASAVGRGSTIET